MTHRLKVAHWNSTVLGYTTRRMWDELVWNGLEWKDRGADVIAQLQGHSGTGYQYLHVAAWNSADGPLPEKIRNCRNFETWWKNDGVFYRVRCRYGPGDLRYKGKKVQSVRVEKDGERWVWILETEDR